MSYLIRVEIPDLPGSLGALAVALGSVGVDILSLEVIERNETTVVDDLVVNLLNDQLPDKVITAAEHLNGVKVIMIRPHNGVLDIHQEFEMIDRISNAEDGWQTLVDLAPKVFRANWSCVCDLDHVDGKIVYRNTSEGSPMELPSTIDPWPLLSPGRFDPNSSGLSAALRDLGIEISGSPIAKTRVLILGRNGGPDFRPAEIARLGYISGILSNVLKA